MPSGYGRLIIRTTAHLLLLLLFLDMGGSSGYQKRVDNTPPLPPLIIEPHVDGTVVNQADVHMGTAPFRDPDADAVHFCSDFTIWRAEPPELIWQADCVRGTARTHIHLADGSFVESYAGQTELQPDTAYVLRIRFNDGETWGEWGERSFRTVGAQMVQPLLLRGIVPEPPPAWLDEANRPVAFTGGLELALVTAADRPLLTLDHTDVTTAPPLSGGEPVRLVIHSESGVDLPQTSLEVTLTTGARVTIALPALALEPGTEKQFWLSENGSTFHAAAGQQAPTFVEIARSHPVPWSVTQPGYLVERVATGFQLPVNIAFPTCHAACDAPDQTAFYVAELYGNVKRVANDGAVTDFATGLLNFSPTGNFPGSGELGLTGIATVPGSDDIVVALLYQDSDAPGQPFRPLLLRLHSADGGRSAAEQSVILDMADTIQGESHQISAISFGPDGYLYVHMGDGYDVTGATDIDTFVGKILRLGLDGRPPPDNPFFNAGDGISAADYVFAYGLRNPFGGAWRTSDQRLYQVGNGPNLDRLAPVPAGAAFGWDGSDTSMYINAAYNWFPSVAPVNIAFIQEAAFGGSGFPHDKLDHAFVTESGATWATGTQERGKRITEFIIDRSGAVTAGPIPFLVYNGTGKGTTAALAAGPDGLYFSDLYRDADYETPIDHGASVFRISFVGGAAFDADVTAGTAPLTVRFTDTSMLADIRAWRWQFGDGHESLEQHPVHQYQASGTYDVRLDVTTVSGDSFTQKDALIVVDRGGGLHGEYFADPNLGQAVEFRLDERIDYDWAFETPNPALLVKDQFSVRWQGQIVPEYSDWYTFYTRTDDGVRLWVDGQLLIDEWRSGTVAEYRGRLRLAAGKRVDIVMEYFDDGGAAEAHLEWSSRHTNRAPIPSERLFAYPLPDLTALQEPPLANAVRWRNAVWDWFVTIHPAWILGGLLWGVAMMALFVPRLYRLVTHRRRSV